MAIAMGDGSRSYGSRGGLLRIGGVDCGFVAATGGGATADVVKEPVGGGKHLASVDYEDIMLMCLESPGDTLTQWIALALAGQHVRNDGEIVELDINGQERSRLSFRNAIIRGITFPALDATSKSPVRLSLQLTPERTSRSASSGPGPKTDLGSRRQNSWQSDNFRLTIDGLDCKRAIRIEQLVATQRVIQHTPDTTRDQLLEPARLEIPDLIVTLSKLSADAWFGWHEDFVVMGQGSEKSGTLEFLGPNGQTLATLSFSGLGIYRLADDTFAAIGDALPRVQATMYCERLDLTLGSVMRSPRSNGAPVQFETASGGPVYPAQFATASVETAYPAQFATASAGPNPPSRADVIVPLGEQAASRLGARREALDQLRAR